MKKTLPYFLENLLIALPFFLEILRIRAGSFGTISKALQLLTFRGWARCGPESANTTTGEWAESANAGRVLGQSSPPGAGRFRPSQPIRDMYLGRREPTEPWPACFFAGGIFTFCRCGSLAGQASPARKRTKRATLQAMCFVRFNCSRTAPFNSA